MDNFFDFNGIEGVEQEARRTWSDFRNVLAKEKFDFKDIDKAKEETFFKVFTNIFENGVLDISIKTLDEINCFKIGRGANLEFEDNVDKGRFVPESRYIKEDNRFSPIGVEWLYLALSKEEEMVLQCAEKECRAKRVIDLDFVILK